MGQQRVLYLAARHVILEYEIFVRNRLPVFEAHDGATVILSLNFDFMRRGR